MAYSCPTSKGIPNVATLMSSFSQAVIVAMPKIIKPKPVCAKVFPHSDPRVFDKRYKVMVGAEEKGFNRVKNSFQAPNITQSDNIIPIGAIRPVPFCISQTIKPDKNDKNIIGKSPFKERL